MTLPNTSPNERGRYNIRKSCEALKEAISVKDYLREHGIKVRRGRCVCPIHDGATNPTSFQIDGWRWQCFSCHEWGDVIDLCERLERHGDTWTAVISLSQQFGVELPQRSERWHSWQTEKTKTREVVTKHLARCYQRRLLKLFAPLFAVSEDAPEEEMKEIEELAAALWPRCLALAERRMRDAA